MAVESIEATVEILLVEPNPGDSRLFTEKFKEAKLMNTVHIVSDGESALDFLHQRGEFEDKPQPDIILLDPQLPGKSGKEVLSELKDDPVLSEIPTVLLTSSDTEEDLVKSIGIDADTYIKKPIEPEEFVSFVQSVEDFWLAIIEKSTSE